MGGYLEERVARDQTGAGGRWAHGPDVGGVLDWGPWDGDWEWVS